MLINRVAICSIGIFEHHGIKLCKMCLKSPGTDVGAAGFERCPRTFETHFSYSPSLFITVSVHFRQMYAFKRNIIINRIDWPESLSMASITCYWGNVSQPSRAMKAFLDDAGIPHESRHVDMLKSENYTDPEVIFMMIRNYCCTFLLPLYWSWSWSSCYSLFLALSIFRQASPLLILEHLILRVLNIYHELN